MTQDIYQKNMIANDGESASFSRLVYKSTIGICVIGKQDRQLLYVNEKMKHFMPEAEIKSRICWNIKHPEEEPCMYCLPFSDSEAGISYEVKVQGEERYCSIVFEEIDWLGTPAYAEYITDITEQVRIQRKEGSVLISV